MFLPFLCVISKGKMLLLTVNGPASQPATTSSLWDIHVWDAWLFFSASRTSLYVDGWRSDQLAINYCFRCQLKQTNSQ